MSGVGIGGDLPARLAEQAGIGLFRTDGRGEIVETNAVWDRLFGAGAAAFSGWGQSIAPADRDRVAQAWRQATTHGKPFEADFGLNSGAAVRLTLRPIADGGGLVEGFAGCVVDIGEARNGAADFRAVSDSMPHMIWLAAPDGSIEYFNGPWLRYTGCTVEDMRRSGVKHIVHPDEVAMTFERWNQALLEGRPYEIQYRLRNVSDGTYRWFLARATPMRDARGIIVRWVGTATDIDAQVRANANLRFVLDSSASLGASLDVEEICRRFADLAIKSVCDWCVITLLAADGSLQRAALAHRDPQLVDSVRQFSDRYPPRAQGRLETVVSRNVAILIPAIPEAELRAAARDDRYFDLLRSLNMQSAMMLPLATPDRVYGAITLIASESGKAFGQDDLDVAEMVARRAAAAIETAHRFDSEKRAAQRLRFLARASELIFETDDRQARLDELTRLLAAELADAATIVHVEDDGAIRTMSAAHADAEKATQARQLIGVRAFRPEAEARIADALSTLRPHLTDLRDEPSPYWEYLDPLIHVLGVQTSLTVPLHSRGEVLGAILLHRADGNAAYSEDDLLMLTDLARRLSIAMEHTRMLERERRIASALQQALLPQPDMLPKRRGLHFAAEYRPSSRESDVGGDWYDALTLEDGRIVVSVGDVTGRGLHAAGLMGKLRQAMGVAAAYESDPARILDAVDFQLRTRGSEALATAFIGIIDPQLREIRYAGAGHPPALLRRNGELIELRSQGLPLGLRDRDREQSQTASLDGAELLVLYTDGLTEATHDIGFGEERLRTIARSEAARYVSNAGTLLCDACLPAQAQDDTAVLVLSFGERPHWRFDAEDAQAAGDARRDFLDRLHALAGSAVDLSVAEIAFGELIGNVVRHAPGPIDVQLSVAGSAPVLHVIDRGKGFVRDPLLPPDPLSESGRGLYIVSTLVRALHAERIPGYGNHVWAELTQNGDAGGA